MRKNIQNITLESSRNPKPETRNSELFHTAENIEVKPTYSKEDIEKLENHGWFITVYEAEKVKQYKNHLVICQETSLIKERLSLACVSRSRAWRCFVKVHTNFRLITNYKNTKQCLN